MKSTVVYVQWLTKILRYIELELLLQKTLMSISCPLHGTFGNFISIIMKHDYGIYNNKISNQSENVIRNYETSIANINLMKYYYTV